MRHSLTLLLLLAGAPALAQDAPTVARDTDKDAVPADLSLYTQASLRLHQQRHAEALRLLDQLLRDHPQSPMHAGAQFFRAQCLEELGRRAEARKAYQALVQAHPKSGWAKDAQRRLRRLAAAPSPAPVIAAAPVAPGKQASLVLTNGDRLSGRIVEREGEAYELAVPGVGKRLRIPRERVLSVTPGKRVRVAIGYSADVNLSLSGNRKDMIVALLNDDDEQPQRAGKTTTRTNPDGSKTVIKELPDGTRVETTIRKQGKDRRITVVTTKKGDGATDERKVEMKLKLDDDEDLEKHLRALKGLPNRLKLKLEKNLEGLEDLDLDLDLDELKDLEKELKHLPGKIRERIKRSLHQGHKRKHVFRWRTDEDEHVFAPKAPGASGGFSFTTPNGPRFKVRKFGNDFTAHVLAEVGDSKDRVYLRNGDKISGKLLSVDGEQVRMKTSYGQVTIKRDQVRQITFAKQPRPYLGVSMASAKDGVKLSQVFDGSPAAEAGLKSGDVVTAANGAPIRSTGDLSKAIKARKVGETLRLSIRRGDQAQTIEVKLGKKPGHTWAFDGDRGYRFMPRAPRPPRPPRLHLKQLHEHQKKLHEHQRKLHEHQQKLHEKHRKALEKGHQEREKALRKARKAREKALRKAREGREQARKAREQARKARERARRERDRARSQRPFLGIGLSNADGGGVRVTSITPGSTAAAIGLRSGDVITHWNGKPVKTAADLGRAIRASKVGDEATLRAKRGDGGVLELKFRLQARSSDRRGSLRTPPAPPAPPARPMSDEPKARDF